MKGFDWRNGELWVEDVALARVALEVGTPCYVYSAAGMRGQARALIDAFAGQRAMVCYAVKANHTLAVIRTLRDAGCGADTVSAGEIERAMAAGVPPSRIVYAGLAKTDDEIRMALGAGILQFNVESPAELKRIGEIAASMGVRAPVALRINPDVAAGTHDKISTGRSYDKFGVAIADAPALYDLASGLAGIEPVGLHMHIGSQITALEPYEAAFRRGIDLFTGLRVAGIPLHRLDLGGGIGVRYRDEVPVDVRDYAALVARLTHGLGCELVLEPGRTLVAEAGVLLASTIYIKEQSGRRFVIVDAGMNVLVRPAMYDAYHDILPVRQPPASAASLPSDVVGPICESSDIFGRDRPLPDLAPGDLLAFASAGAYGSVMSSDYNSRPSAAQVLVDGARFAVIKPRREPRAQFADETLPNWLASDG